MSGGALISLIEVSAVFGLFIALCLWQLRDLNKLDREDAEREAREPDE